MARRSKAEIVTGPKAKIDISRVLKLRAQGLPYHQIGKLLNCSAGGAKNAVGQLGKLLDNQGEQLKTYRENEASILDAIRYKLIAAIGAKIDDPEVAKKLDLHRLTWAYAVLFDKQRLLRGESTANVAQLTAIISAAHREKRLDITPPTQADG